MGEQHEDIEQVPGLRRFLLSWEPVPGVGMMAEKIWSIRIQALSERNRVSLEIVNAHGTAAVAPILLNGYEARTLAALINQTANIVDDYNLGTSEVRAALEGTPAYERWLRHRTDDGGLSTVTLRDLRKVADLTQCQLAAKLGTWQPNVSEWERGIKRPRPNTVRALAQVLGVPVGLVEEVTGCSGLPAIRKGATK